MNIAQHAGSALIGFVTTTQVLDTQTELPKNKSELIGLASAVLVQTLIYGVTKFFKWISSKNETPTIPPSAPLAPTS